MEGRYGFQEAHWEVLDIQVSFQRLYVFSWPCTDEGSSLRVLESRSLEAVETPFCKSRDASLGCLNNSTHSTEGELLSKKDWNITELNQELEVEKGRRRRRSKRDHIFIQGEELDKENWHFYYWHLFPVS